MLRNADDAHFWDKIARRYATDPIKDVAGYERTLDRTLHYFSSTDTVLELGCGTGTTALRLAPHVSRMVAADLSGEMIKISRGRRRPLRPAPMPSSRSPRRTTHRGPRAHLTPCSHSTCCI